MSRIRHLLGITALAAALFSAGPVGAQTPEAFYQKNQIKILVSSSPGGGYDSLGRLLARYLNKHIPGSPPVLVQNMPGAGGIKAANFLYNIAPKDGSTMAIVDRGVLTFEILYGRDSAAEFEAKKFVWLGSAAKATAVGVVSTRSPAQTLEQAKKTGISFGSDGLESDTAMYARLVNQLVGTQIKTIQGYKDQTDSFLAMERGETDGLFLGGWSGPHKLQTQSGVKAGTLKFLVQITATRHEDFGNTPTVMEMVTNEKDKQVVEVLLSRLELGRPFIMPPGTPVDRVAYLRKTFDKIMVDPAFVADSLKEGHIVDPISGEDAQKSIERVFGLPDELVTRIREIVNLKKPG